MPETQWPAAADAALRSPSNTVTTHLAHPDRTLHVALGIGTVVAGYLFALANGWPQTGTAMVAAVFFPWARKSLFQASPASEHRIAGVPLMSITGAVAAVFLGIVLVMLWNDEIAAGPLFSSAGVRGEFWLLLGLVVFGILWYLGIKAYRRRRGIDISLAFKQIPIE